jgi:SAM-dependent methyltransferase
LTQGARSEDTGSVRCPLCDRPAGGAAFEKGGYPITRCECGMVFVASRIDPAVLDRLYGEGYFEGGFDEVVPGYRGYANEEAVMRRNFARRLTLIERIVPPGPLLDVGCALGFFVRAALDRGWDARGVELSEYAAGQAAASGLPVSRADFLTMDIAPGSLTAVTMLDMLEHTASPRAYVRRARAALRPGGVVAIETGDLGSAFARLSGRRYHFFTPPNHLTYFTRATLGRLLREEGFGEVQFVSVGKWVTVARILYHLYVRSPRPALRRVVDLAERTGAARLPLPVNVGDDMLALGRATG